MDFCKKSIFWFLFLILCAKYALAMLSDFNIQPAEIEQPILTEIITNYLTKYFRGEKTTVSIILPPSERKDFFHKDFLKHLLDQPSFSKFPHRVQNHLDKARRGRINLLFIDDSKSIS